MLKTTLTLIAGIFFSAYVNAQEAIDLTDQTIKIKAGKEEEILLGFAAGDKIIFNFNEENKKELKEVEIIEYPSNSKFSDYKVAKIEQKQLQVNKQGVYIFRFKNSSLSGRICKIKIQRIPASSATADFNSTVTWVTKQDTVWNSFTENVLIGYDTAYLQKTKLVLVKIDTTEQHVFTKTQRVHSEINSNGNKSWLFFSLPQNSQNNNTSRNVIAWAYWVGVGDESNKAWQENLNSIKTFSQKAAALFTSPLGALATGFLVDLALPKLGEDVSYSITNEANKDLWMSGQQYRLFDKGKGIAGYKIFTRPDICQGTFFICLENDNFRQGIDVNVKVSSVIETKYYEPVAYTEQSISPRYEKQIKKEPRIKTKTVPVVGT